MTNSNFVYMVSVFPSSHFLIFSPTTPDIADEDTTPLSFEEKDRPTTSLLHEEPDYHWVAISTRLVVRVLVAILMLCMA